MSRPSQVWFLMLLLDLMLMNRAYKILFLTLLLLSSVTSEMLNGEFHSFQSFFLLDTVFNCFQEKLIT